MKNGGKIKIDYYQGAYGPTLRMDLSHRVARTRLKDILQKLATGSITEFKLHGHPFIELTGLQEFYLKTTAKRPSKTVEIIKAKKTVCYWSNCLEGWNQCVGLLDGLAADVPSHQYLSEEGVDDALIVVAYLESAE